MLDLQLWEIITNKMNDKREDILSYMVSGKYQDIVKYREDVGFLNGLKFVEDVVRDAYKPKERIYD